MKQEREESPLKVVDLSPAQADTLSKMRRNDAPWCLNKSTAAALLRRGLIAEAGVCCKEHNDPTYVLVPGKDHAR